MFGKCDLRDVAGYYTAQGDSSNYEEFKTEGGRSHIIYTGPRHPLAAPTQSNIDLHYAVMNLLAEVQNEGGLRLIIRWMLLLPWWEDSESVKALAREYEICTKIPNKANAWTELISDLEQACGRGAE